MQMRKTYGANYRVEIDHFTRSGDGVDLVDSMYWVNYNDVDEAVQYAQCPKVDKRYLIETRVYDMVDSKDLIWKKDWINNTVEDFTTIPSIDYHNREYD